MDFKPGNQFKVFEHSRNACIDLRENKNVEGLMQSVIVPAISEETLELDNDVLGRLEDRSHLERIGIVVQGTAGLFDPGWAGKATLELSNLGRMPVALHPGMRTCSFTFVQLCAPSSVPYRKKAGSKYAGRTRPLASRLAGEFKG